MTRTRRARPELTESWDNVDDLDDYNRDDGPEYTEEDEREEMRSSYRAEPRRTPRNSRVDFVNREHIDDNRRRSARLSVEPELIMPSSPNAEIGRAHV